MSFCLQVFEKHRPTLEISCMVKLCTICYQISYYEKIYYFLNLEMEETNLVRKDNNHLLRLTSHYRLIQIPQ